MGLLVDSKIREFPSGANRDSEVNKPDYEGCLSPIVLRRFAEYMAECRTMRDGSTRDSDNWQKGMPKKTYLKSLLRHVIELWSINRGWADHAREEDAVCAVIFNAMGYLFENLVGREG